MGLTRTDNCDALWGRWPSSLAPKTSLQPRELPQPSTQPRRRIPNPHHQPKLSADLLLPTACTLANHSLPPTRHPPPCRPAARCSLRPSLPARSWPRCAVSPVAAIAPALSPHATSSSAFPHLLPPPCLCMDQNGHSSPDRMILDVPSPTPATNPIAASRNDMPDEPTVPRRNSNDDSDTTVPRKRPAVMAGSADDQDKHSPTVACAPLFHLLKASLAMNLIPNHEYSHCR